MTNLEAALAYQARGWSVVPAHSVDADLLCSCTRPGCTDTGKHPRVGWLQYQRERAGDGQVRTWWRRWPTANIAIVTGKVSGLVVLDIDPRHGGDESLRDLGKLPDTLTVLTGGGGQHLYYAHPGGVIPNGANLLPGIDVRGDGGYVIAPPSNHQSGGTYLWEPGYGPDDGGPLAPLPEALLSLLLHKGPTPYRNGVAPTGDIDITAYLTGGAVIREGERNATMTRLAGHLFGAGNKPEAVLGTLLMINTMACQPPLQVPEVQKVMRSINDRQARKDQAAAALEDASVLANIDRMPDASRLDLARAAWEREPLGVPGVVDWVKLVSSEGVEYQLELPDRVVSLGGALLGGLNHIREVLVNATGVVVPRMKGETWDKYAGPLARLAREEQVSAMRPMDTVDEWVEEWRELAVHAEPEEREEFLRSQPVWYDDERLAFRKQRLMRWLLANTSTKWEDHRVAKLLKMSGWEYRTIYCGGKKAVRVWLSPRLAAL